MAKDSFISGHIDQLMLDPNNYRFIDSKEYTKVIGENIIDKKVQIRTYNLLAGKNEENISDLISSFRANGILKLDPIQVKSLPDGNFLVVEGNRRTAALKYLYTESIKANDVGKLEEKDFEHIELILIDSESTTQHLITMGLHHISGKKKWSPLNQAQLVYDLRYTHKLSEEDICDSLAITKHNLRRSLRTLAFIGRYKSSDFGDQFQTSMYSIFEEIIKNVKVKNWLRWNDFLMEPDDKLNEERIFSWISREEVVDRNEDDEEEQVTVEEPIITKSHEIRELADFIEEPKAIQQMEASRSITAGYVLSDAVGESRLKNALDNIAKEVQTAFQFSEYMTDDENSKTIKIRDKLNRLLPNTSSNLNLSERTSTVYFKQVSKHFTSINILKYRKLHDIKIDNLNRVNLFVGGNNSGKTTILEMFYLFTRLNNFQSIIDLEKYRGRFYKDFPTRWFDKIFVDDIQIEGQFNNSLCAVEIKKYETSDVEKSHYLNSITTDANVNGDNFTSTIHLFDNKDPEFYFERSQFLCNSTFSSPYRYDGSLLKKAHAKAIQDKYFDEIIDFIRRNMDASIEKIEMVSIENESRFMVTTSKMEYAIDITKYGEGLQRVFEIALLLGFSNNGVMCIDEIDSAIHKSLLVDFTQFIQEGAKRFNVQVFLSTHSKECIDAFVENKFPDDELVAYSLNEVNNQVDCKFLEGNKLKQLVESVNIDIR